MADRGLLEREPIAIHAQAAQLNLELAEESARLLGYAKLKKALGAQKGIGELGKIPSQLDIQPFFP